MNNAFIKKTSTKIIKRTEPSFNNLRGLAIFFNDNRSFIINDCTPNTALVTSAATTKYNNAQVFSIIQYISDDPSQVQIKVKDGNGCISEKVII